MANSEHVKIIKQGVDFWNMWRKENPDVVPDLGWANLVSLDLSGVVLSSANLKLAFCRDSKFVKADFHRANLYGTNFQNSDLADVNFENANLEGAHITNANLSGAIMRGVNLKLSNLDGSDLSSVDLTGAKKLKIKQLLGVKTLKNARLDNQLMELLKSQAPELLE